MPGGGSSRSTTSGGMACLMPGGGSSIWGVKVVSECLVEKMKGLNTKRTNSKGQKMGFFNGQYTHASDWEIRCLDSCFLVCLSLSWRCCRFQWISCDVHDACLSRIGCSLRFIDDSRLIISRSDLLWIFLSGKLICPIQCWENFRQLLLSDEVEKAHHTWTGKSTAVQNSQNVAYRRQYWCGF